MTPNKPDAANPAITSLFHTGRQRRGSLIRNVRPVNSHTIMKSKPNPEEFARQILWPLCGLQAESQVMLQMFARHIEPDVQKANAIYLEWALTAGSIQRKLYAEALSKAGIPLESDRGPKSSDVA